MNLISYKSEAKTFPLKDEQLLVILINKKNRKEKLREHKILYVNQPSSISMRELPFPGPVRTGEGARD